AASKRRSNAALQTGCVRGCRAAQFPVRRVHPGSRDYQGGKFISGAGSPQERMGDFLRKSTRKLIHGTEPMCLIARQLHFFARPGVPLSLSWKLKRMSRNGVAGGMAAMAESGTSMSVNDSPVTRASLLLQIRDGGNRAAWQEFMCIYGPVVYGFARKRGLQDA